MNFRTVKNALNLLNSPWSFIEKIMLRFKRLIPDKLYLQIRYRSQMGRWPNFSSPQTFTEKINWLKLYNRNELYTMLVDKYAVKEFVKSAIGEKYVIQTLGVWDKPEDIDWTNLPKKFVLKTTNGGGSCGVVICKDKNVLNKNIAKAKLNKSLHNDIFLNYREWPYKNVKKRIIAEYCLEEKNNIIQTKDFELSDFKFFCFNGEPKFCQVIRGRESGETIDFYDMQWNHMPFVGLKPGVKNGDSPVPKPSCLSEMQMISKILSKDIPFSRIDLYYVNEQVYFGEITFFPASGFGKFTPSEWDLKLGSLLDITSVYS